MRGAQTVQRLIREHKSGGATIAMQHSDVLRLIDETVVPIAAPAPPRDVDAADAAVVPSQRAEADADADEPSLTSEERAHFTARELALMQRVRREYALLDHSFPMSFRQAKRLKAFQEADKDDGSASKATNVDATP